MFLQGAGFMECHDANVTLMDGVTFHDFQCHSGIILQMCFNRLFLGWKFGRIRLALSHVILAVHNHDVTLQNAVIREFLQAELALMRAVTCVPVRALSL